MALARYFARGPERHDVSMCCTPPLGTEEKRERVGLPATRSDVHTRGTPLLLCVQRQGARGHERRFPDDHLCGRQFGGRLTSRHSVGCPEPFRLPEIQVGEVGSHIDPHSTLRTIELMDCPLPRNLRSTTEEHYSVKLYNFFKITQGKLCKNEKRPRLR